MLPTAPAVVHGTRSISKWSSVQNNLEWQRTVPLGITPDSVGLKGTKATTRDRGDMGCDPAGACGFYLGSGLSVQTGILTAQHSHLPQGFTKNLQPDLKQVPPRIYHLVAKPSNQLFVHPGPS